MIMKDCLVPGCAEQIAESADKGGFKLLSTFIALTFEPGAQTLTPAFYLTVAKSATGSLGVGSAQAAFSGIHFIDSYKINIVVHRCVPI